MTNNIAQNQKKKGPEIPGFLRTTGLHSRSRDPGGIDACNPT